MDRPAKKKNRLTAVHLIPRSISDLIQAAATTGSGPSLKYLGADIVAGQWGAWSPIGAEAIAGGYEVASKLMGADQYTVWHTDTTGNDTVNITGIVSGTSATLESLETSFQQDLNGDGTIGLPPTAALASIPPAGASFSIANETAIAITTNTCTLDQTGTELFVGSSEANSSVSIGDGSTGTMLGQTTASSTGAWSMTVETPLNATHSLSLTATDSAGHTEFANVVAGTKGNDTITASAANETLFGNGGSDTFVFGSSFGKQVIADFQTTTSNHDVIQFNQDVFRDLAAVLDHAAQVGSDVVITADAHDTVTLHNVLLASLQHNDFHFV